MTEREKLSDKIAGGGRISREEALSLFKWDLLTLGDAADRRRRRVLPHERVGFIIDRIINYTNLCEARCAFCAFHAGAGQAAAYELTAAEIKEKIKELLAAGGSQVMLQGGLNRRYALDFFTALIREIKEEFPSIYLHSFSPSELAFMADISGRSLAEVIARLKAAGLDSVPGASDLLVERIRKRVSPGKAGVERWREVMRALHEQGMQSSATMTYGMGETNAERVEHLSVIRDLQDETSMLRAFIPWSFSPRNTRLADTAPAGGVAYLKLVAIARIFLDNVTHIQAGWLTEGLALSQVALAFGASDMGGVLSEELVVRATGIESSVSAREFIDSIRAAGKIPVLRDSCYNELRSFDNE